MIVTKNDARKIIAQHYGKEIAKTIRFIKRDGPSILIRPSWDSASKITLAWRKLAVGQDSTIWIGRYLGAEIGQEILIDWNWSN